MTTADASRPIISFLAASSRPHKPCQLCFDSFTLWGKASGKLGYYSSRENQSADILITAFAPSGSFVSPMNS